MAEQLGQVVKRVGTGQASTGHERKRKAVHEKNFSVKKETRKKITTPCGPRWGGEETYRNMEWGGKNRRSVLGEKEISTGIVKAVVGLRFCSIAGKAHTPMN